MAIKIEVPAVTREAVHAAAAALEKEHAASNFGVDLGSVLIVRTLRELPALKSISDYFKAPSKGGKLKSAEWADLLARFKVLANAAAINVELRGYGKKSGTKATAVMDDVG